MNASARMRDRAGPRMPFECLRPERAEAEAAFRTIIGWAGDDSERDGPSQAIARTPQAFSARLSGRSKATTKLSRCADAGRGRHCQGDVPLHDHARREQCFRDDPLIQEFMRMAD